MKSKALKQSGSNLPAVAARTPANWQFRCMLSMRGTCVIKPWLDDISMAGQANLDRSIEHLHPLLQQDWHKPHPASNIGDSIYVIRFKDETRKQHRIYGHFHNSDYSFVMTLDGYEKDDKYYPSKYDDTSAKNRDLCNIEHENKTIRCRYAADACGEDVSNADEFHLECRACFDPDDR
ncbi:MAG: hypothetical protein KJ958_05355 [Gammaproteobacteria bacterium]|nr:hypothetical protein [Gammaproteobacteria bacterium]MBU1978581.1 hypothetical protein [Gammaproteobacteria bacterium]